MTAPAVIVPAASLLAPGGSEYLFGVISRMCDFLDEVEGWGGLMPEVVGYQAVAFDGQFVTLELEVVE